MKEIKYISPFKRINGYPLIELVYNNKKVYFLINSGIRETILDSSFYFENGGNKDILFPYKETKPFLPNTEFIGVILGLLTIGSQSFKDVICLGDFGNYFKFLIGETEYPVVGCIGSYFLNRKKIHFDFESRMIYSYSCN